MNKPFPIVQLTLISTLILTLSGCGGSEQNSDPGDAHSANYSDGGTLVQNESVSGTISELGEVDWYSVNVNEPGIIAFNVYNKTLRYDVDILATVYEEDVSGKLKRLAADHFPENSARSSSLSINVNITEPKTLHLAVRDLDDNDLSVTESYSLSYDISEPGDNNDNFDNAVQLAVNGSCETNSIGNVGDTDVFQFTLEESGVYELSTEFNAFGSGSSVELKVSLYSEQGELLRSVSTPDNNYYRILESLPSGGYFLLINDHGKDNFDTASPFTTCLSRVNTDEVSANDTIETANRLSGNRHFTIDGALDYSGDIDWNQIDTGAAPESIQVLEVTFDPSLSNGCNLWYLLEIIGTNGEILFSKEYSTETGALTSHVKVQNAGEHFVSISAVDDKTCYLSDSDSSIQNGLQYSASITALYVDDDAEMGATNNTINTATELDETSDEVVEAKISHARDVDWYKVTVPASSNEDRVLEIFIETESPTSLEYYINVFLADRTLDTFTGKANNNDPTQFKTSYFIPRTEGSTDRDYFIKVVDLQSDEAEIDNNYTIETNIVATAETISSNENSKVIDATFNPESTEQAKLTEGDDTLTLVISSSNKPKFSYIDMDSTSMPETIHIVTLDPSAETPAPTEEGNNTEVMEEEVMQTIEINFPWQAGYIDYYKDRDWFKLDLKRLYSEAGGSAEQWYCDFEIELYSPTPGSNVEYAWGLYRDSNNNGVFNDWKNGDGLYASNGDTNRSVAQLELVTPGPNGNMWVNHNTGKNDMYLTISDIVYDATNGADNDWGYDQPYYLRVKLTFHSGLANP